MVKVSWVFWAIALVLHSLVLNPTFADQRLSLEWVDQHSSGSKIADLSQGVALGAAGDLYVSGWTSGMLGSERFGSGDAFVSRYDRNGTRQWTEQLGSSKADESWDIATDGFGNVFFGGQTTGSLGGDTAGGAETFVSKYDDSGEILWIGQIGGAGNEQGRGIATDLLGNVYATGYSSHGFDGLVSRGNDVFVTKFDSEGVKQWTKLYGTESVDRAFDIETDGSGNIFLTGYTWGEFPGFERPGRDNIDAFVMKLDSDGVEQWTHQLGTREEDYGNSVAVDALGNSYITGYTGGELEGTSAGEEDVFLTKFDPGGELLWTRQFGAIGVDSGEDLFIDEAGKIYVTGRIESEVRQRGSDQGDGFVSKYDGEGNLLWMDLFGTNEFESSQGIEVDAAGAIYVSGFTHGNFDGSFESSLNERADIFVAKYSQPVPEPISMTLALIATSFAFLLLRNEK